MPFFAKRKVASSKKALQSALGDYEMPKFPAVAMKAMKLLRREGTSLDDVARVIMGDPGISTRMLTMVNSAAYALRHPVNSIPQATALLGTSQVESLVVAVAVAGVLPAKSKHLDMTEFWRTASRRAAIASGLAARLHPTSQATSYTAGLLQDMAIPILMESRKEDYASLFRQWQCGEADIVAEERKRYNRDHAEVAGWMCREWSLPETLASNIAAHHGAVDGDIVAEPAIRLVSFIRGAHGGETIDALIECATSVYSMNADECARIVAEGQDRGDESARLFR
ncbi:MAG: HDOD domain-containing protein [Myxococcales bacterium]|nr:HDOD domain-containing protein [Myxococcales bacterium]